MKSPQYDGLVNEVGRLSGELLDAGPRERDSYSYSGMLRYRAFVVFSHAELEWYWERMASSIVDAAEMRWQRTGNADSVLSAMMGAQPETNARSVNSCLRKHRRIIQKNNGIKGVHINNMFAPLGVPVEDIDPGVLLEMEKVGYYRGEVVHRSYEEVTEFDDVGLLQDSILWLVDAIGRIDERLHEMDLLPDPAVTWARGRP